jgi:hypothetical protein
MIWSGKTVGWGEYPFTVTAAIEAAVALFSLDDERRKRLAVNLRALTLSHGGPFDGRPEK